MPNNFLDIDAVVMI